MKIKRPQKNEAPTNFYISSKLAERKFLPEKIFKFSIYFFTLLIVLLIFFLIGYVIYSSTPMYKYISFWKFIFTANWKPTENKFGIGMIIAMTLVLLLITMIFAVPLTLFMTVFIHEFLPKKAQKIAMTLIQLLAGIPSVVFGLFARQYIGAFFRLLGAPSNDNLMVAALTMTFMAIPTMVSLSYNALKNVPDGYRYGSLGLGISREKTAFSIVIRSAKAKLITAVILGISRVVGETMAIMMIAGNASGGFDTNSFSSFLFSSIRTLASTIGLEISETASPQHKAALFAIATFLFVLVFLINLSVLLISNFNQRRRHRSKKTRKLTKKPHLNTKFLHPDVVYTEAELGKMVNLKTKDKFWKKTYSGVMLTLMVLSLILVTFFIFWILGSVVVLGLGAFRYPKAFIHIEGQDGIFAAFLTTLLLIVGTLIFAIPLALVGALYLAEYANPHAWTTKSLRFIINLLSSTPSIIFGIFGLQVFIVLMGLPFSIFVASLTMTIVILPMLISNFEDALTGVPPGYREAGAGLGMTRLQQLFRIVLPYSREGLLTGIILATARIIGESAPVYLTLGTAIRMPAEGFLSGGATLTTAIYMLAAEAQPGPNQEIIYLIALITVILVFSLNIGSEKISQILTGSTQFSKMFHWHQNWPVKKRKLQNFSWEKNRIKRKLKYHQLINRRKKSHQQFKNNWNWSQIKIKWQAWRLRRREFYQIKNKEDFNPNESDSKKFG